MGFGICPGCGGYWTTVGIPHSTCICDGDNDGGQGAGMKLSGPDAKPTAKETRSSGMVLEPIAKGPTFDEQCLCGRPAAECAEYRKLIEEYEAWRQRREPLVELGDGSEDE